MISKRGTAWCDLAAAKAKFTAPTKRPLDPMGDTGPNHPIVRCPECGRRLRVKAVFCVGGEFVTWTLPKHKIRETRRPGPKRKQPSGGRGR